MNIEEEGLFGETERANFIKVISSFKYYKKIADKRIDQKIVFVSSLPQNQQKLLDKYKRNLNSRKQCIESNYLVVEKMLSDIDSLFVNSKINIEPEEINLNQFSDTESDKVQITLKQIVRDWGDEGANERSQCYDPIIKELLQHFDIDKMETNQFKVLVPGSGLARLCYEISLRGFYCEGNEISLFMLIASNFILNRCLINNQFEIYPYCHQFVNNQNRDDSIVGCRFPDISPCQRPPKGEMNMVDGDFLQVYSEQSEAWDCVCSCYFLDCANNIVEFLEVIYNILRPGGIFINIGPLLYHHCDASNEFSIEPSYEDIRDIIKNLGFRFLKEDTKMKSKYSQNPKSMAQLEYDCAFFVVQKIPKDDDSPKTN